MQCCGAYYMHVVTYFQVESSSTFQGLFDAHGFFTFFDAELEAILLRYYDAHSLHDALVHVVGQINHPEKHDSEVNDTIISFVSDSQGLPLGQCRSLKQECERVSLQIAVGSTKFRFELQSDRIHKMEKITALGEKLLQEDWRNPARPKNANRVQEVNQRVIAWALKKALLTRKLSTLLLKYRQIACEKSTSPMKSLAKENSSSDLSNRNNLSVFTKCSHTNSNEDILSTPESSSFTTEGPVPGSLTYAHANDTRNPTVDVTVQSLLSEFRSLTSSERISLKRELMYQVYNPVAFLPGYTPRSVPDHKLGGCRNENRTAKVSRENTNAASCNCSSATDKATSHRQCKVLIINMADDPCCVIDNVYEVSPFPRDRGKRYIDMLAEHSATLYIQAPNGSHLPSMDSYIFDVQRVCSYVFGWNGSTVSVPFYASFIMGINLIANLFVHIVTLGGLLTSFEICNGILMWKNWSEDVAVQYMEAVLACEKQDRRGNNILKEQSQEVTNA